MSENILKNSKSRTRGIKQKIFINFQKNSNLTTTFELFEIFFGYSTNLENYTMHACFIGSKMSILVLS